MAISIEHLTSENVALVTITPNETLETAVSLMIEHDFSQLPVVENDKPYGKPASFVTSNSIAHALKVFRTSLKDLLVKDAVVTARTVSIDEDLFTKMDDILDSYAVLVLYNDGTIANIVTNYDTTQYFRKRAEDMLLVEDIETTLKDHIRAAYGGDETDQTGPLQKAIDSLSGFVDAIQVDCRRAFRRFCDDKTIEISNIEVETYVDTPFTKAKNEKVFDDLTLNEYIQLARKEEAWSVLSANFSISSDHFLAMLDGVRITRNKLMHFRPDIAVEERENLRFCARWFKNHPPLPQNEEGHDDDRSVEERHSDVDETLLDPKFDQSKNEMQNDIIDLAEDRSVESKYAPLARYLLNVSRGREKLILPFSQIETIIGTELPAAAREHRAWWANDSTTHAQSQQWLNVNWRVISINMSSEKVTFGRAKDRERAYIEFFSKIQNRLKENPEFPLLPMNPLGVNWLTLANFNEGKQRLILSFAQKQRVRLEIYIDTGNQHENKSIIDRLFEKREFISNSIEGMVYWERLDHRRASRIALYKKGAITDKAELLEQTVEWTVEQAPSLYEEFAKELTHLG
jgi:predicted transcriptional regulator